MNTVPVGGMTDAEEEAQAEQPSRTWKLDWERGRASGMTDGLEAVRQAVHKLLLTDRFRHAIYSSDYGHELRSLIGSDPVFLEMEIDRMLQEALLADDRITGVGETAVEELEDGGMRVLFTVNTIFGSFEAGMEVRDDG
jgi:Protein of unknown function (DUF2634).